MKVTGRAIAKADGYYPVSETGACDIIKAGQEFDLYEGHDGESPWFERVAKPRRKAQVEEPPADQPVA